MKIHGNQHRDKCPICGSRDFLKNHWRIPYMNIEPVVSGGVKISMAPLLSSDCKIYSWSLCQACGSTFMDPFAPSKESYKSRMTHAEKFIEGRPNMKGGFEWRWGVYSKFVKPEYRSFLDAGCGAGQYLWLAHEGEYPWDTLTGWELSEHSVRAINYNSPETVQGGCEVAIEADVVDLDIPFEPVEQFDFIVCSECLEHFEQPTIAMANLVKALAPGGRFFFTCQSPTGGLPIRPAEPIYASKKGMELLVAEMGLNILYFKDGGGRWLICAER